MCKRSTHYVSGAASGAGYTAVVLGTAATLPVLVAGGLASAVTSGGRCSPDCDQFGWWKRLDRHLPDELLLFGGPMRHRGITHWWGLPLVPTVLLYQQWGSLSLFVQWLAGVLLAGWWSHLLTDFGVGARYSGGRRQEYDKSVLDRDDHPRGPGIPLFPWWLHVGLGYKNGSWAEQAIRLVSVFALLLVAGWRGAVLVLPLLVVLDIVLEYVFVRRSPWWVRNLRVDLNPFKSKREAELERSGWVRGG